MLITPKEEWGPISGPDGTIHKPGEAFQYPDDKAVKLIASGKAELVEIDPNDLEGAIELPADEEDEDAESD